MGRLGLMVRDARLRLAPHHEEQLQRLRLELRESFQVVPAQAGTHTHQLLEIA
jgi:hypothetical protein